MHTGTNVATIQWYPFNSTNNALSCSYSTIEFDNTSNLTYTDYISLPKYLWTVGSLLPNLSADVFLLSTISGAFMGFLTTLGDIQPYFEKSFGIRPVAISTVRIFSDLFYWKLIIESILEYRVETRLLKLKYASRFHAICA